MSMSWWEDTLTDSGNPDSSAAHGSGSRTDHVRITIVPNYSVQFRAQSHQLQESGRYVNMNESWLKDPAHQHRYVQFIFTSDSLVSKFRLD